VGVGGDQDSVTDDEVVLTDVNPIGGPGIGPCHSIEPVTFRVTPVGVGLGAGDVVLSVWVNE
jgi:hypothetical protein